MPTELLTDYLKLPVFALVAARLAGLIMFQPLLSNPSVPTNLRVLFVLALALLVTPFVDVGAGTVDSPSAMAIAMAAELALGVVMGLAVHICVVGIQIGGMMIAQESGLAFGAIADPTGFGDQENVLSVVYLQLAMVVFLIVGGHRVLISAALDTFDAIPLLGQHSITAGGVTLLFAAMASGTELGIRIAAPAVLTMFLVNIVLGFISRTVPGLNVTILGFSLKTLIAFLIMAVTMPVAIVAFTGTLHTVMNWLPELWEK